ncbi:MAG: GNAT family N-acetyltransferase [Acidobacteria bacterium]|nr:GNAT family N-acetyltransferase [Acidobacteriota bacterium]
MELTPSGFEDAQLRSYAALFTACFPGASHLHETYLRWLYRENPAGTVVGFDAWESGRLAAHYVCVPASVQVGGAPRRALLSLNTATHPDFQGRGLFTRLAEATYARGTEAGYDLVFGVANANSTPGFVRKLGFHLVTPLDSWIGVGRLRGVDWTSVGEAGFARAWPAPELAWRLRNPASPVRSLALPGGSTGFLAATGKPGISAWAELPGDQAPEARGGAGFGARVFLGRIPGRARPPAAYTRIPDRLRPSPLNLIVRGLGSRGGDVAPDPSRLFFTFLDFDAF